MIHHILPPELIYCIFNFLSRQEIIKCSVLSKLSRKISHAYLIRAFGTTPAPFYLHKVKVDDLKFNNDHKRLLNELSKEFVVYGHHIQALLFDKMDFGRLALKLKMKNNQSDTVDVINMVKIIYPNIFHSYYEDHQIIRFYDTYYGSYGRTSDMYIFRITNEDEKFCYIDNGVIYYTNYIKQCIISNQILCSNDNDLVLDLGFKPNTNYNIDLRDKLISNWPFESPCIVLNQSGSQIIHYKTFSNEWQFHSNYRNYNLHYLQITDLEDFKKIPKDLIVFDPETIDIVYRDFYDIYSGHFFIKTQMFERTYFFKELILGLKVKGTLINGHSLKLTDESMVKYQEVLNIMTSLFTKYIVKSLPKPYQNEGKHRFIMMKHDHNVIEISNMFNIATKFSPVYIGSLIDLQLAFDFCYGLKKCNLETGLIEDDCFEFSLNVSIID